MACHFEVGQDVVCINDKWTTPWGKAADYSAPKRKDIVRIKRIVTVGSYMDYWWPNENYTQSQRDDILLLLSEYGETGFLADHFRPLKKTSIEQLKSLLVPSTKQKVVMDHPKK